jgi:hypothetical protein
MYTYVDITKYLVVDSLSAMTLQFVVSQLHAETIIILILQLSPSANPYDMSLYALRTIF